MKTLELITPICCGPGTPPLPAAEAEALAARFKALADPSRVAILDRLAEGEACVCDLNATFALSQPTISHHLKVLRDAGLDAASRRGTWAFYRDVPEALDELSAVLSRPAA